MTKPDLDQLRKVPSDDYKWLFDDSPRGEFVDQIESVGPDAYVSEDEEHIIFTDVVMKAYEANVHTWGIVAIPWIKYYNEDPECERGGCKTCSHNSTCRHRSDDED